MKKRGYQSWTISGEFWDQIKKLVPARQRDPNKTYQRKPRVGRKPLEPRRVLEGILYALRNGCLWKAIPREYGAASSVHAYFQLWLKAGFFEELRKRGLWFYDEMEGIGWEWQSIDGSMVKAPLALEAVGHNPTARGKMGTKRSILVESSGVPLTVVISGANTHDVKLLEKTLDAIIITRPEVTEYAPQHLCADAAYTGKPAAEAMGERAYTPHVRSRGEEKTEKQEGK